MNGYIAFYRGHKVEVHADSAYAAQCKAAEMFKQARQMPATRKTHEVTVVLAEKNGQQVTHTPSF